MDGNPQAWSAFCDRFAGLVTDVVDDTLAFAGVPGLERSQGLREALAEDFFRDLRSNGFAMLRSFHQESSLATYMAVIARRSIMGYLTRSRAV